MTKYRITEKDGRYYAEVRCFYLFWQRLGRLIIGSIPPRWADIDYSSEQEAQRALDAYIERAARDAVKPRVIKQW